ESGRKWFMAVAVFGQARWLRRSQVSTIMVPVILSRWLSGKEPDLAHRDQDLASLAARPHGHRAPRCLAPPVARRRAAFAEPGIDGDRRRPTVSPSAADRLACARPASPREASRPPPARPP